VTAGFCLLLVRSRCAKLTRAVRLTEADDRSRLVDLALAAEQVRYAAAETAVGGLDEPLARGRELLDRLDGVPSLV